MKRLACRIFWWFYVVWFSLRWIPSLHLGRSVWWRGAKWTLIQGVCAPRWDLMRDGVRQDFVHENEFRAVQNPVEWWRAFRFGYRFYMGYWYDIWLNEGIQAWMRACNIWARAKRR